MLSFRQKIILWYLLGLIAFILFLYPLSTLTVRSIVRNAMEARSKELIDRIAHAKDNEELVTTLKDQKMLLFFRVSVITNERKILYDSHTKRLLGASFSQDYVVNHPEVLQAEKNQIGYHEDWSELLQQKFAYLATPFNFQGKTYILRTAFPYRYLTEVERDFELGFLALGLFVLLASSFLSWLILNHFTKPIQRIIAGVRPYQEGMIKTIPLLEFPGMNPKDEFARLAGTLNALNTQIQRQIDEKEALLQMRKDFTANASHELKTPITIIRGFAEMLDENPGLPHEAISDATKKIVRNCARMEALVRDLLTLANVENLPSSRLQEFDLMETLKKSRETTLELFPDAIITLKGPAKLPMMGDPDLIEMATLNLINNAAKYSTPPAQVTVEATLTSHEIVLTVNDRGIGIPEKELPHIFERFYRVDKARSRSLGGSGLGLSIVQTVVQKHRGTISVISTPERGTTFTLRFPL